MEEHGPPGPVKVEELSVSDSMGKRLLHAVERTAGFSHSGYLLNGLTGPGPFAAPRFLAPVRHPDLRLSPPLSRHEREAFERITAWLR